MSCTVPVWPNGYSSGGTLCTRARCRTQIPRSSAECGRTSCRHLIRTSMRTPPQLSTPDQTLEANSGGRYVLWFEADLYDQLQLAEILARLAGLDVPAERITLICIGEYPGIAHFGGLGELYADQLRTLPGAAGTRLSSEALGLATQAWAAFRSRTPDRLGAISASLSTELRFLPEAFDRLSREYPSTRDGLSLTERRILAAVAEDANTAEEAFLASSRRESRPFLGDLWCFRRIAALANARSPLLWLDDAETSA